MFGVFNILKFKFFVVILSEFVILLVVNVLVDELLDSNLVVLTLSAVILELLVS